MTVNVSMVDVAVYLAARPRLGAAFKRFLDAKTAADAWSALQDIKAIDTAESGEPRSLTCQTPNTV
jgi:hypothetical protein